MDTLNQPTKDTEAYRDAISTVDQKGKRVWIYPKKPKGRFYNWRKIVSYLLLAFLFGAPFIKVNGEPLLLFNVLERHFIIFGIVFAPQDFHILVLGMLTLMVFIVLFTVVFGRLFCGWICPQTIFMEMVFRRIEYFIEGDANAQKRLNKGPWTREKLLKKTAKQAIFFGIAVLIANTFLAYIIGVEEVFRIATEPVSQNWQGFTAMMAFSFAFYFVFSYMREQVCVAICPYGRMQGVLLDNNSIVVAYDHVRGEPRGKIKKKSTPKAPPSNPIGDIAASVANAATTTETITAEALPHGVTPTEQIQNALGDCIDCKLCVQVCPTGIDIRNGTQLECINCTACMDACDEVMDKVGRERGLIRYASENGIVTKTKKIFTPRVIAYTAVLTFLVGLNVYFLTSRTDVEALILRTPGMLYQEVDDTYVSNLYNYQVINKTKEEFPVEFRLVGDFAEHGRLKLVGETPTTLAGDVVEGALFIELERAFLTDRKTKVQIEVYSGDKLIDRVNTNFLGPIQ